MRLRNLLPLSLLFLACSSSAIDDEPSAASTSSALVALKEVTGFGTNPGALKMFEYAPATLKPGAPAVLVLHGCTQGARDASTTGWTELADELGFLVVFPEQTTANNPLRCFNWAGEYGDPANLQRGRGENQSLKEMVDKAIADHGSDPKRVFVVGFSAGGAEAAVALATWPDVFAGGATIAGVPYNCTTTYAEVSSCQKPGKNKTPAQWGALVKAAHPGFAGPYPRVSIWQGSADTIVGTANRTELVEQWTDVHGVAGAPAITDTVDGHAHAAWKDASGKIVVETYEIATMAHAVPISATGCGAPGAYASDKGICAARHVATFFGLAAAGADGGADGGSSGSSGSSGVSSSSSTGGVAPEGGAGGSGGATPGEDRGFGSTCALTPARATDARGWLAVAALALAIAIVRTKR
ncbi:MAG: PHB depolymerase family esterase [Labilithrix sp.]|nr:PHB depolymerase family esterase [Labilithrix sp.]